MATGALAMFWMTPGVWPTPVAPGHVLYILPDGGLDTPPDAPTARKHSLVTCLVATDGVETAVTITHNMGVSSSDLAAGLPEVNFEYLSQNAYAELPVVVSKSADTVVLGFLGSVAVELGVQISRPNALTR